MKKYIYALSLFANLSTTGFACSCSYGYGYENSEDETSEEEGEPEEAPQGYYPRREPAPDDKIVTPVAQDDHGRCVIL